MRQGIVEIQTVAFPWVLQAGHAKLTSEWAHVALENGVFRLRGY